MKSLRLPSEDPRIKTPLYMKDLNLNQMKSLRLPSEDPRIKRPLYMKGEIRPPVIVCQGFMPLEHEKVEEQTCSCKNNGKRCQNRYTCPKSESSLDIKKKAQTTVFPETI